MAKATENEIKSAVDLCKEILTELDGLPEQAEIFQASIEERVLSMQEWIEENSHVTPKQVSALENMMRGVKKWKQ